MGLRETRRVQSRASSAVSTLPSSSFFSQREQTPVFLGVPSSKEKGVAASSEKVIERSHRRGQTGTRTRRATARWLVSVEGVLIIRLVEWSQEFVQIRNRRLVGEMEDSDIVVLRLSS